MTSKKEFDAKFRQQLTGDEKETVKNFLERVVTMKELGEIRYVHRTTVDRHLKRACTVFLGQEQSKNLPKLVEVFYKYREITGFKVGADVLEKYGIKTSKLKLESPEGTVPLKSPFYVERYPIESDCYQTIVQPGALIPIKAPRQMGKTSLLDRIIDYGRQQKYQTVRLNLRQISAEKFAETNTFMRCFCALIRKELPDNLPQIDELWDDDIGGTSATKYLQAILEGLEMPLVLALDEVDRVFDFSDIYQYFLPLLRSWHEEANNLEIWENLRLVVVHSTEDYGRLNLNQSPFNVQAAVELRDFLPQEIVDLKERHMLNLDGAELESLAAIIGGHPYLVRLAFYHLARQDMSMELLLENAATDAGIYQRHLLRHLEVLTGNTDLKAEFKKVLASQDAVEVNPIQSHKLYSMGLIVKESNLVKPRCRLYRQYFQERL